MMPAGRIRAHASRRVRPSDRTEDVMVMPDRPSHDNAAEAERDPVHEEAERIAVPAFDWIGQPIAALIDAATSVVPHRHTHDNETPDGAERSTTHGAAGRGR